MNTNDKFKSLEPLLEIKNLKVQFPSRKKMLTAVDGVKPDHQTRRNCWCRR